MKREFRYQPGQVVPGTHLRIVRPIGYGGMGAIYECEETFTGLRYVLKVIHPELVAGKGMLARMEREAKVLARLKHPNIIQIFWAGLTDETPRLFYYVMETLNGYSLRRLCRKAVEQNNPLPIDAVLKIGVRILNGLDHAHRHDIVHRDIKPDNVFVHSGSKIKLIDFGIVHERGSAQTTSRGFVGTVAYAPPELFTGGEVTPATDIWSVGVLLFEALAGELPFGDAATEYALAQAILTKQPRRPSSLRPDIPPELDNLILRMLEKDPKNRPSDAHVVGAQLSKIRSELVKHTSDEQGLLAPGLMEGLGPPSITNVDEDLDEEQPPSSELRDDESSSTNVARSPAGPPVVAVPRARATDVLTPSVVERAAQHAVGPVLPAIRGTEVLAVAAISMPSSVAIAERAAHGAEGVPDKGTPAAAGVAVRARPAAAGVAPSRPSVESSAPWARALRLIEDSPTVRRPPLPDHLALSARHANTPAHDVQAVHERPNRDASAAPRVGLREEPPRASPPPATQRIANPEPAAAPPQTAFQPFKVLPAAGPARDAERMPNPQHPRAAVAGSGQVRGEVAKLATGTEPLMTERVVAAPASGSVGARARGGDASRVPLARIDWDTVPAEPPAIARRVAPIQAAEESQLGATGAPSVATLDRPLLRVGARRAALVFMGALVSTLAIVGGLVAISSHRAPTSSQAASQASGTASTAVVQPLVSSPVREAERLEPDMPGSGSDSHAAVTEKLGPTAPSGAPAQTDSTSEVAAGAAAPVVLAPPAEAEALPSAIPAPPAPRTASSGAATAQPRSKVSRQRAAPRPAASARPYNDLPFHTSSQTAPHDDEVFGAAFLSHGQATPTSAPAAPKPRPAGGSNTPSRGTP